MFPFECDLHEFLLQLGQVLERHGRQRRICQKSFCFGLSQAVVQALPVVLRRIRDGDAVERRWRLVHDLFEVVGKQVVVGRWKVVVVGFFVEGWSNVYVGSDEFACGLEEGVVFALVESSGHLQLGVVSLIAQICTV